MSDPAVAAVPKDELESSSSERRSSASGRLLRLARFMSEDADNVVFRRFEDLHLLNLLAIQHDLVEYAEEISLYRDSGDYQKLGPAFAKIRPLLESYGSLPICCCHFFCFEPKA
jgi:hypothetical protein